jgi:uncharacterized membrane protein YraQ (UPF0718 family)
MAGKRIPGDFAWRRPAHNRSGHHPSNREDDSQHVDWLFPQPYSPLIFSLVTLTVGPLVYRLARVAGGALGALDGFVFVAIGGLVLLHIVPESIAVAGWLAAATCLVGLLAPSLAERWLHGRAGHAHAVALALGLVAIGLHAFTDGLALAPQTGWVAGGETDGGQQMLPMAVILHRLPIGLTIWLLLRPAYGWGVALGALVIIGAATGVGFASGGVVQQAVETQGRAAFQAFVAGSLLHVIVHRSYPISGTSVPGRFTSWYSGLGALGGIALVWGMADDVSWTGPVATATEEFVSLSLQSAPALLLAYVAAGLVYGLMPAASVKWMGRGSSFSQALRGMGFGLPLPICSCGVVPVYRSLVVQGVPATAAMAFLVATPELSIDAVLISVPLLGGEFTVARVVCAATVALAVGWGLGRLVGPSPLAGSTTGPGDGSEGQGFAARVRDGLATGLGEVVDSTGPWIILGLALAAVLHPLLDSDWTEVFPDGMGQIEFFALLGMPAYVCASGATPLVAVLVFKGISPGAALAFLLTGPATNITTFGVLSKLHGRGVALAFGGAIAAMAIILGHVVDAAVPEMSTSALETSVHWEGFGLSEICLFALTGLFVLSLVRRGPREFVGEIFNLAGSESDGDHDHEHAQDQAVEECCGCTPAG